MPPTSATTQPDELAERVLLAIARYGLLLVPFLPLVCSGQSEPIPPLFFPDITPKHFAFRFIVEIVTGCWLILAIFDRRYRPRWNGAVLAFTVYLAIMAVADVLGVHPQQSFWSNFERMQGLVADLHLFAFLLVASIVFDRRWWERFFLLSLCACAVVSLFCVMQWLHSEVGVQFDPELRWLYRIHQQVGGEGLKFRMDARLGSPVFLAAYLMVHVPLALCMLLRARSLVARVVWSVAVVVFLFCLGFTSTRSAQAGLLLGLSVSLLFATRAGGRVRTLAWIALAAFAVLVAAVTIVVYFDFDLVWTSPFFKRFATLSHALWLRETLAEQVFQGWLDHPILGWGQNNFPYVFDAYHNPRQVRLNSWYDHSHNVFLESVTAGGILGLAALSWFLWAGIRNTWRTSAWPGLERALFAAVLVAELSALCYEPPNLCGQILFFSVIAALRSGSQPPPEAAPAGGWPRGRLALVTAAVGITTATVAYRINVPNIEAAARLTRAIQQTGPEDRPDVLFRELMQMDTFATREIAEQAGTVATRLLSDPRAPKPVAFEVARLALQALEEEQRHGQVRSHVALAELLAALGRAPEAREVYERARQIAPNRILIYLRLAQLFVQEGRREEAIHQLRTALGLLPRFVETISMLAQIAMDHGDEDLAQEMLAKLNPERQTPRFVRSPITQLLIRHQRWQRLIHLHQRQVDYGLRRFGTRRWDLNWLVDRYVRLIAMTAGSGDRERALALVDEIATFHAENRTAGDPDWSPQAARLRDILRTNDSVFLPLQPRPHLLGRFSARPRPDFFEVPLR